jgi:hypothetical protein
MGELSGGTLYDHTRAAGKSPEKSIGFSRFLSNNSIHLFPQLVLKFNSSLLE